MSAFARRGRGEPSILTRTVLLVTLSVATALVAVWLMTFRGPRPRPPPYRLADVAAMLSGQAPEERQGRPYRLERLDAPPAPRPGYRFDPTLSARLKRLLGPGVDEVRVFAPGRADLAGTDAAIRPGVLAAARSGPAWRVARTLPDPWFSRWDLYLLTVMGGVLALLTAPALLMARRISRPLRRLAERAVALGEGRFADSRLASGPPEVLRIAEALDRMHAALRRQARERGEMLGAVAHDLRTPLTRLAFLVEGLPDDEREEASAELDEMRLRIDDMMALVKETGAERPRRRLDLASLVSSLVEDRPDYRERVRLTEATRAVVAGDPESLRRSCAQLIDNALKFGGSAEVAVRPTRAGAEVTVDDRGPGLAKDDLERAFEPYFRAEASRNRETGGAGLGLALVRGVAEAHGGTARLAPRAGGGLSAILSLPVDAARQCGRNRLDTTGQSTGARLAS